jgi:polyisoprenoid-binding protein YceI
MRSRTGRTAATLFALLTIAAAASAATETFNFDKSHSKVGFQIRHWLTKVEGRFREYEGQIVLDRENPANSRVDVTIRAASIDTDNERRDADLKSDTFFDVEKYPTITFKSSKVVPTGKDQFDVTGDMTMHGVTKTIKVPVHHTGFIDLGRVQKAGFEVTFPINRKDFGITWNRTADQGGVMLGDEVEISLLVEANKEMPAPPAPEPTRTPSR